MFDIGSTEFLLVVVVAVIVIGPKDLPRALYKVGQVVGKARGMARHFRTGIDAMIREAELEDLEKKWAAQNKRILDEHPATEMAEPAGAALPAPEAEPPSEGAMPEEVPAGTGASSGGSAFPGFPPPPPPPPAPPSSESEPPKDGATA